MRKYYEVNEDYERGYRAGRIAYLQEEATGGGFEKLSKVFKSNKGILSYSESNKNGDYGCSLKGKYVQIDLYVFGEEVHFDMNVNRVGQMGSIGYSNWQNPGSIRNFQDELDSTELNYSSWLREIRTIENLVSDLKRLGYKM